MISIERTARQIAASRGPKQIMDLIKQLRKDIKEYDNDPPQEEADRYREAAITRYAKDGEIEIDSDAAISKGDDPGAYVAAWVWVRDDDLI
jgi:hypothetical protein